MIFKKKKIKNEKIAIMKPKNAKNTGYNDQKSKSDFFFFRPTLLHDHAASRLVKNTEHSTANMHAQELLLTIPQLWPRIPKM